MALTIAPQNVKPLANAILIDGKASGAIVAGQVVYLNADGRMRTTSNLSSTATVPLQFGIAVSGSAFTGHMITYQIGGDIKLGNVLNVGLVYGPQGNSGDITSGGTWGRTLGVAISANTLRLKPQVIEVLQKETT